MRAGEGGATKDEMVGWHHRLKGHESEQIPGESEGQGSLAHLAWGLRGHKESDTTEQLNDNKPLGCERISFCCSISPSCHSAGTSEPGGGKDTVALAELTFQSGAGLATEGVKNKADGKSLQTMAVTRLIMLPTQKCEHRCPRILCALTGYSCLS